jgi:hypothetical protein
MVDWSIWTVDCAPPVGPNGALARNRLFPTWAGGRTGGRTSKSPLCVVAPGDARQRYLHPQRSTSGQACMDSVDRPLKPRDLSKAT